MVSVVGRGWAGGAIQFHSPEPASSTMFLERVAKGGLGKTAVEPGTNWKVGGSTMCHAEAKIKSTEGWGGLQQELGMEEPGGEVQSAAGPYWAHNLCQVYI